MKWIDRSLLRSPYYIGLCITERAFKREVKRLGIADAPPFHKPGADASTYFFDGKNCGMAAIICLRVRPKITGIQICALLAHEAVHVWQAIRKDIGESEPAHEQEAYAIQNITQGLCEAYYRLAVRRR